MPERTSHQLTRANRDLLRAADRRARSQLQRIKSFGEIAFMQCFRTHLQATVRHVSPLAFDVVAAAGHGFDDILHDLRPGPAWLRRGSGKLLIDARAEPGPFGRSASDLSVVHDDHASWLSPAQAIAALRPRSSQGGYAGIRVVDRAVEVVAAIGDCHLSTEGGLAWLTLGDRLPETLRLACVGRQVAEIVDCAMFIGRDYPIGDAFDLEGPGGTTVLLFNAGLAMRRMPWPELHLV